MGCRVAKLLSGKESWWTCCVASEVVSGKGEVIRIEG